MLPNLSLCHSLSLQPAAGALNIPSAGSLARWLRTLVKFRFKTEGVEGQLHSRVL